MAAAGQVGMGLGVDIEDAHRTLLVKEAHWALQACKSDVEPDAVYLNTVGTFGVASESY